jgi:hypothetical protein
MFEWDLTCLSGISRVYFVVNSSARTVFWMRNSNKLIHDKALVIPIMLQQRVTTVDII